MSITFAKGHGTENDFVLLDDPEGALDLTPELVRALTDRRAGLGGDGVIRVVRTAALAAGEVPAVKAGEPEWFMDYRNADGSLAEMCGNGVRVFVTHLVARGWLDLPEGHERFIATRAGVTPVRREGGQVAVDLGPWRLPGRDGGAPAGGDVNVALANLPVLPGLSVALSNPHVVVVMPDVETLAAVDLTKAPVIDPPPPAGANVELVVPLHDRQIKGELGHLAMRVHERGVGETRSCGTGAVAAALALRCLGGPGAPDRWRVDVPGGTLQVTCEGSRTQGELARLAGPAVIVAEGQLAATFT